MDPAKVMQGTAYENGVSFSSENYEVIARREGGEIAIEITEFEEPEGKSFRYGIAIAIIAIITGLALVSRLVPVWARPFFFLIFQAPSLYQHFVKDRRRSEGYHGAEHKVYRAHQANRELTFENVKVESRFDKACGSSTSVYLLAIFCIVAFPYPASLLAAFAVYAIAELMNKYPQYLFQSIMTKEPTDAELEVAIAALNALVEEESNARSQ